jgi:hypothetical protein
MAVLALSGCGGGDDGRKGAVAASEAMRQRFLVQQVVGQVYDAYTAADGDRLCALIHPRLQRALIAFIRSGRASADGSCAATVIGYYKRVPPRRSPRAIFEADAGAVGDVRMDDRGNARIAFGDGGSWDLAKSGERWLITRAPLLPKSAVAPGRTPPALRATPR